MSISKLVTVPCVYRVSYLIRDQLLEVMVTTRPQIFVTKGYVQTWLDENIPGAKVVGADQLMAFEIE